MDEKLNQTAGLYYENRGLVNIITSKWDLTTYIDLDKYTQQWEFIDTYLAKTEQACRNISHNLDANCNHLLFLVNSIAKQCKQKRDLIFS
jgi:hypothetical protein